MSNLGQNTGSKKQNLIIIVLALLVVIAVGVIVFLVIGKEETTIIENPSGGRGTVATKDNIEEILKDMESTEPVPDGHYTTSMSINWHFNGQKSTDAYVANDVVNTRTVYFDLILADTEELIYSSPYIPVGAELKGVTLDKELEPGTYETVLVYHLVDDNEKVVSTLSVGLTIYVK